MVAYPVKGPLLNRSSGALDNKVPINDRDEHEQPEESILVDIDICTLKLSLRRRDETCESVCSTSTPGLLDKFIVESLS